ncbi:histone-lysine N-methyltransferase PRDM9-like isoform X2 [Amphibalanus amphitrite]|uniref:histone-lysine N-methyltransferase PRDM9-like isoform X2 n=1 Tax=Amphibalanus amphitrite TaxID=1232801 RepID=UPI001C902E26|nr:histone-lysine N-methyltransferase PRDM9-like isoform X2 [Amphibalanus amphitrite]XP_043209985.1 histone-lysine N-methyltransferase PRDM9-like isoform X2 [Amphibalanus amphitrite]
MQSNYAVRDSMSESNSLLIMKKEIKVEPPSPRAERPSSPSMSDDDPLSDRAVRSLVKEEKVRSPSPSPPEEEKVRSRSPSPSEDFIGFTEVDRDSAHFASIAKTTMLLGRVPDSQDIKQIFSEGGFGRGQSLAINYRQVDGLDDDNIFCEVCCREWEGDCPVHGPLKVIPDTKARPGIGDPERDLKTIPQSLSSGLSRIPGSNTGVWTERDVPARVRFGPYDGTITTGQRQAKTTGYSWEIMKGTSVHHSVNAEDSSCSNWLRRVNCARSEEEQNLTAFQHKGLVYFRTSKPIPRGSELLVYYGDDSARELTVHSETSGESVTSSPAGPSSSGIAGTLHGPHCDFNCLERHRLDRRLKTRHVQIGMNGRYKCKWCCYVTDYPGLITRHRRTHAEERPYRCDVCGKTFSQQVGLTAHRRVHTGQSPYKCDICGKAFTRSGTLTMHRRVHVGEKVRQCEQSATECLATTNGKEHKTPGVRVKPHQCHECRARFVTRADLTVHIRTHTGEKPYSCSICPARFAERSHLVRHMRTHTGEKPYGCSVCPARFALRSSVTEHMRTHTGEKPFCCSICPARFAQRSTLTNHMRTHTGEKPFGCSICPARFAHQSALINHMRIHTGEKPYGCSICPARFTYRSSLTAHMRTHSRRERPHSSPSSTRRVFLLGQMSPNK